MLHKQPRLAPKRAKRSIFTSGDLPLCSVAIFLLYVLNMSEKTSGAPHGCQKGKNVNTPTLLQPRGLHSTFILF